MAQCPDCDSIKVAPGINEGDGKCSVCHGDGHGTILDRFAENFGAEKSCYNCDGTGDCPTCGGTGEVED